MVKTSIYFIHVLLRRLPFGFHWLHFRRSVQVLSKRQGPTQKVIVVYTEETQPAAASVTLNIFPEIIKLYKGY
jgi:hypothetical protein